MRTIVMTGGTSGFGRITLKMLAKQPDTKIILGCRDRAPDFAESIPLDLSKLQSVRFFAEEVIKRAGDSGIDSLVLNAGIQMAGLTKTSDGFETTFAVNHLAHFLLLRLLLPVLNKDAIVVLTSSGTHDPLEKTIIPPPRHADANLLAFPENDPGLDADPVIAGGRAYSSSKLCVVLTARYLAKSREASAKNLKVIAYDPGPTPGTGLVRNNKPVVRFIWSLLSIPVIRFFIPKMNSRKSAGKTLAGLATGKINLPSGRVYAALRKSKITFPDPSEMALQDDLMVKLWNDSEKFAGL